MRGGAPCGFAASTAAAQVVCVRESRVARADGLGAGHPGRRDRDGDALARLVNLLIRSSTSGD